MRIQQYTPEHKTRCIEIFESNQPKYFAAEEKSLFVRWLNDHTVEDYYVMEQDGIVIACGGIFYDAGRNEGGLSWGMVHAQYHQQGFGKQFTQYRLELLRSKYPDAVIRIETSQHTEAFYKKMGFTTMQIIPGGFAEGLDKYIMQVN